MNNRLGEFTVLNHDEQLKVSGGLGILGVVGLIAAGVIVNEVVERTTGSDIPSHIGNGLQSAGNYLQELGSSIVD